MYISARVLSTELQEDFEPIPHLKVRHGVAADQGGRSSMEDATTAILDFRDSLSQELAVLTPEANSYFGVTLMQQQSATHICACMQTVHCCHSAHAPPTERRRLITACRFSMDIVEQLQHSLPAITCTGILQTVCRLTSYRQRQCKKLW